MNKLKQLYETFLSDWNDKSLYKTSLTENRRLFQYKVVGIIFIVTGVGSFLAGKVELSVINLLQLAM